MTTTDLGKLDYSDLAAQVVDYSVDEETTDAGTEEREFRYFIKDWPKWFGYYKHIPELRAAIDAKATWTVGKGFKAEEFEETKLSMLRGIGIDSFNTILENMIRVYYICGDAFAEIIRDEEGVIINLRPLDPSSVVIVSNSKGMILRYEQISKIKKPDKKLSSGNVFHLARNRTADEIHGSGVIESVEEIILMRNEAMSDWKRVLHRNIDPLWIFHLDTDDTTKIADFKAKMDKARGKGENLYIPKEAVVPELVGTSINATLNPIGWINSLNEYFYEVVGTPKIIIGGANEITEASAKIVYLAFQQNIEEEQLYIEEQVGQQLGLTIELEFPVSLENELLSDKAKDGAVNIQPNETTAGVGA